MTTRVNEASTLRVTLSFRDPDGSPVSPTTLDWKIRDVQSDTDVVTWTSIPTPGTSEVVDVDGADNAMVNADNTSELREILVRLDNGLTTQRYAKEQFLVVNLGGVT